MVNLHGAHMHELRHVRFSIADAGNIQVSRSIVCTQLFGEWLRVEALPGHNASRMNRRFPSKRQRPATMPAGQDG
ncbi:hypothetical protein Arad_3262 [Rhizobium rhizogenes K84]|uniref:Uncharacterized protein n=1 Tax=Rhizobium rhizogenes (strain K84 / ATCC BAA-868) TaxID=311403 RepID=B9J7F1_RHIR8|nr:hypothetical protein Arad_3262 [Rhizobium rhizogenes K84]